MVIHSCGQQGVKGTTDTAYWNPKANRRKRASLNKKKREGFGLWEYMSPLVLPEKLRLTSIVVRMAPWGDTNETWEINDRKNRKTEEMLLLSSI